MQLRQVRVCIEVSAGCYLLQYRFPDSRAPPPPLSVQYIGLSLDPDSAVSLSLVSLWLQPLSTWLHVSLSHQQILCLIYITCLLQGFSRTH